MAVAFVSEMLTPIEVIEQIAAANNWEVDHADKNELVIFVEGRYSEYEVAFSWLEDVQAIHMACGFELEVSQQRLSQLRELTRLLNESAWVGHFDYWREAALGLFRHAVLCPDGEAFSATQAYVMLAKGMEVCEANHAAFKFVVEDNLSAAEALASNITETKGNA